LWRAELDDARQRADAVKALAALAGLLHLDALGQAHHAKRGAAFVATLDHVQVAHLENAQRQQTVRKQHQVERKQRQFDDVHGSAHGLIMPWRA
jgi:3,4-dihydroxy-2-butanone 4-phosphate synthase